MNADTLSLSATRTSTTTKQDTTERKFALLKRSGLFNGDLKGCTIERASSAADLKSAYRLVHDVFVRSEFLKAEPAGIRLRMFETAAETATFVAKQEGMVVGVISIVGDSPALGLPSDSAFKTELNDLRAKGLRLFEITNQAVAEEYRRSAVATELMFCAMAHVLHAGYDRGIASVSPSHLGFYTMMGFDQAGSERSYSDKLHDPVIALSLNLDKYRAPASGNDAVANFFHHALTAGNRYHQQVIAWGREARKAFLSLGFLTELFVSERDFISECTASQLVTLKMHWGEMLFSALRSSANVLAKSEEAPIADVSAARVSDVTAVAPYSTHARSKTPLARVRGGARMPRRFGSQVRGFAFFQRSFTTAQSSFRSRNRQTSRSTPARFHSATGEGVRQSSHHRRFSYTAK